MTYVDELVKEILLQRENHKMRDFLKGILTPQELIEISKRLAIVKMLKKGVPHHTIAKRLGVGVATVTRGSKELSNGRFKTV